MRLLKSQSFPDRDGVFICKIFIPPSRDLGINKRDLAKVGWLACHMNTFCFSMRFFRIARSRLAETARSTGTARLHMNSPLVQRRHCVKSAGIRSFSGPHLVQIRENTDQKNSKYGHFSRSAYLEPGPTSTMKLLAVDYFRKNVPS